ncbi:hypothetical protein JCM10213v2_004654 [Rhodosporidiobolus nylandii]
MSPRALPPEVLLRVLGFFDARAVSRSAFTDAVPARGVAVRTLVSARLVCHDWLGPASAVLFGAPDIFHPAHARSFHCVHGVKTRTAILGARGCHWEPGDVESALRRVDEGGRGVPSVETLVLDHTALAVPDDPSPFSHLTTVSLASRESVKSLAPFLSPHLFPVLSLVTAAAEPSTLGSALPDDLSTLVSLQVGWSGSPYRLSPRLPPDRTTYVLPSAFLPTSPCSPPPPAVEHVAVSRCAVPKARDRSVAGDLDRLVPFLTSLPALRQVRLPVALSHPEPDRPLLLAAAHRLADALQAMPSGPCLEPHGAIDEAGLLPIA